MSMAVERLTAEIDADPTRAVAALRAFSAELDKVARNRTVKVTVKNDQAGARKAAKEIDEAAKDRTARIKVETDNRTLRQTKDALDDIATSSGGAGDGIRYVGDSANYSNRHMGGFVLSLKGLAYANIAGGALVGLAGGLQAVSAAAVGAVGSLTPLVGLLGTLPVGLGAIAGATSATVLGLSGVAQGVKAMSTVTGQGAASLRNMTGATRGLEDAQKSLARAQKDLADAQNKLSQARAQGIADIAAAKKQAAEDLAEAKEAEAEASEDEQDALKKAKENLAAIRKRASEDMVAARKYEIERQKALSEELVDSQWGVQVALHNEEAAVRNLEKAQRDLEEAQNRVSKSGVTLTKETDFFSGKVHEIAMVTGDATDAAQEQADAQWAVKEAEMALVQAKRSSAEAEKRLSEARDESAKKSTAVAEQAKYNAETIKAAEERLAEVKEAIADRDNYVTEVRKRNAERIAEVTQRAAENEQAAQERVANAHETVKRRTEDLASAKQRLIDVQNGGTAATNNYKKAMENLSPAGQKFVRFLVNEFLPSWKQVRLAAQEGLLPGVQRGLESLIPVMPQLANGMGMFAKSVGDAFGNLLEHLTGDAWGRAKEASLGWFRVLNGSTDETGRKFKGLNDALIPLADIFIGISRAAEPMTKMLTDDIVRGLDSLASKANSASGLAKMTDYFNEAYRWGGLWMSVLRPLGGVIGDVVGAAKPLAEWMLRSMASYFEDLHAKTTKFSKDGSLQKWFDDQRPVIKEVTGLILDVMAAFNPKENRGKDSPLYKFVAELRKNAIPALNDLMGTLGKSNIGETLGKIVTSFIQLFNVVASSHVLEGIATALGFVTDGIAKLHDQTGGKSTDVFGWLLTAVAGFALFNKAAGGFGGAMKDMRGTLGMLKKPFGLFNKGVKDSVGHLDDEIVKDKSKTQHLGKMEKATAKSGKRFSFFNREVKKSTKALDGSTKAAKKTSGRGGLGGMIPFIGGGGGKRDKTGRAAKGGRVGRIGGGLRAAPGKAAGGVGKVASGLGKSLGGIGKMAMTLLGGPWMVAIGAVVGGLTLLYKKNEAFRNFVNESWTKIKGWIKSFADWFVADAWPKITTVLEAIGKAAVWLWKKGIKPAFGWIWERIKDFAGWFSKSAWPVIKKVFNAIGDIAVWLWKKAIRPSFDFIKSLIGSVFKWLRDTAWPVFKTVFGWIGSAVSFLWNKVFKPYFGFIKGIVNAVFKWLRDTAWPIFKTVFGWITEKVKWVWNKIFKPYFGYIKGTIGDVFNWLRNTAWPKFRDVFGWIGSKVKNVYNDYIKKYFGYIKKGAEAVTTAFSNAKTGIGKAWSGIVDKIRGPIRTVLTFIDKKFISKVKSMLHSVDLGSISRRIPYLTPGGKGYADGGRVGGYAGGGMIPGPYKGPRKDNVLGVTDQGVPIARVNPREYILPVKATKRLAATVGNAGLEALRRGEIPGYNIGGKTSGLNQKFLSALAKFNRAAGGRYSVISGLRTRAEQERLYNLYRAGRGNLAARPGTSRHETGNAADLAPSNARDVHGALARKYGIHFPVPGEAWHAELIGGGGGGGIFSTPWNIAKKVIKGNVGRLINGGSKVLNAILNRFGGKSPLQKFGIAAMKKTTPRIYKMIDDGARKQHEAAGDGTAPSGNYKGGNVEQYRSTVLRALKILGLSDKYANSTLRRMNQESSGNPGIVNMWDSNWRRGQPSVGLMQVIRGTYAAYKHPRYDRGPYKYGVSTNPLSNILASMRYALGRYGNLWNAYDRPGGYNMGGLVGRQYGGSVRAGQPVVVGEKRPEIFMPNRSGRIVPSTASLNQGGGMSIADMERLVNLMVDRAKPNVQQNNTINERVDTKRLASEIAWVLR